MPCCSRANCEGTAATNVDDEINLTGPNGTFNHQYNQGPCNADVPLGPTDVSSILQAGTNSVQVEFINSPICQGPHGVLTDHFLVQT